MSARARRVLRALVLGVGVALPAGAVATTTTVFYPLQVSAIQDVTNLRTWDRSGGLVMEFQSNAAGVVQPGGVRVTSFHLGFRFSGDYFESPVIGRVDMQLTGPWQGWWLNPNGWLGTPMSPLFVEYFDGLADLSESPAGRSLFEMTPTGAGFHFLNGNPFTPGGIGGPLELRASFDVLLTENDFAVTSSAIGFTGQEAARITSAPEPASATLSALVWLAAVLRRRSRRAPAGRDRSRFRRPPLGSRSPRRGVRARSPSRPRGRRCCGRRAARA